MNYEEERHAEKLLADGWMTNEQAAKLKAKLNSLEKIPNIIRGSTWKTPQLRASAAKFVEIIIRECQ